MENMEIERKFLPTEIPYELEKLESHFIEQGYLNTEPVVRVRRTDNRFTLTYKSGGMFAREEYNLPLNESGYLNLVKKSDGNIITKRRYLIPLENGLTGELDVFEGALEGLVMLEVEFESTEQSDKFVVPEWFGKEVTFDRNYHNSNMSKPGYVLPRLN